MDPNMTLLRTRQMIARIEGAEDAYPDPAERAAVLAADAPVLAELVSALDTWMSGGGFKPREWCKRDAPPAPIYIWSCDCCGKRIPSAVNPGDCCGGPMFPSQD